jgi:hypothetical protein
MPRRTVQYHDAVCMCGEASMRASKRVRVSKTATGRRPFACPHGMVWNGLYRTSENDLGGISKLKCCSVGNRVRPSATGLLNAGQNCWGECQSQQGPCAWCGSGSCCRQRWIGNGCDGLIGDPNHHVCSAGGPPAAPTAAGTVTLSSSSHSRRFCVQHLLRTHSCSTAALGAGR